MVTLPTVRTNEGVNFRKEPSKAGELIRMLNADQELTVLGRDATAKWLKVQIGNETGWVRATYTNVENITALQVVEPTVVEQDVVVIPVEEHHESKNRGQRVRDWQKRNTVWLQKDNNALKVVLFGVLVILIIIVVATIIRNLQTPPGTPGGGDGGGGVFVPGDGGDAGGQGGVAGNGEQMAEAAWGEDLPWPAPLYVAGGPGMPDDCAGLCWDFSHTGILRWYGPNDGEEDVSQSDRAFGNGQKGPLDMMRDGDVNRVIFPIMRDAVMEVCPRGTLDGKPIADYLREAGYADGQCGRFPISSGWHIVEGNSGFPQAGFGIRFTATAWAGMDEAQIRTYTGYWRVDGTNATWTGPANIEIMLVPGMVQMMQDFGSLRSVTFTTSSQGEILFCNGSVTGTQSLSTQDGRCETFQVSAGTYTYTAPTGENRTSAGISWQPQPR